MELSNVLKGISGLEVFIGLLMAAGIFMLVMIFFASQKEMPFGPGDVACHKMNGEKIFVIKTLPGWTPAAYEGRSENDGHNYYRWFELQECY